MGRKESRKQETLIGTWGKPVDSRKLDRSFQSNRAAEKAKTQRLCATGKGITTPMSLPWDNPTGDGGLFGAPQESWKDTDAHSEKSHKVIWGHEGLIGEE